MATLNIGDHRVNIDDAFLKLSPADQQTTVAEIAKSLPATAPKSAEQPDKLKDVAKQSAAGLAEGTIELPATLMPNPIESLARTVVSPLLKKFAPQSVSDAAEEFGKRYEAGKFHAKSILPEAETPEGQHARNITAAIPPTVAAMRGAGLGSIPSAISAGLGSGAAVEATKQVTDNPLYQTAAGVLGGGLSAGVPKVGGAVPGIAAREVAGNLVGLPPGGASALYYGGKYVAKKFADIKKADGEVVPPVATAAETDAAATSLDRGAVTGTAVKPDRKLDGGPLVTDWQHSPEWAAARARAKVMNDAADAKTVDAAQAPLAELARRRNSAADWADLNAQAPLAELARRQKGEPFVPEAPVDLSKFAQHMGQPPVQAPLALPAPAARPAPQELPPVINQGGPAPQLALPAPNASNRPPVINLPGQVYQDGFGAPGVGPQAPVRPAPTSPSSLGALDGAGPQAPVAPPQAAPQAPVQITVRPSIKKANGVTKPPEAFPQLPQAAPPQPQPLAAQPAAQAPPVVAPKAPTVPFDDGSGIPAFLRRDANNKPVSKTPVSEPVMLNEVKATTKAAAVKEAEATPVKTAVERVVDDTDAPEWHIPHDKSHLSPWDAASAMVDKMVADGKPIRTTPQQVKGYISRVLKDKNDVVAKLVSGGLPGKFERHLKETLWGLKDRGAALAKIDQLAREFPKQETLLRSTLEPKVEKWWKN